MSFTFLLINICYVKAFILFAFLIISSASDSDEFLYEPLSSFSEILVTLDAHSNDI